MLNKMIARSLMAIVPNRFTAAITINYGADDEETVSCPQCWEKPIRGGLEKYGNISIQGDETLIKVPDHILNPKNNARQIRAEDRIVINGEMWVVTGAGATLETVQTVWTCVCRKIIPSS